MFSIIGIIIHVGLSYLVADKIGRNKSIGFNASFLICIFLTPFAGYLITEGSAMKNAPGCTWCGNKENEAEYCGLCGKNKLGDLREAK